MEQQEHGFNCPYCFQEITILIDPSVAQQDYIEDCEVCCNPIEFNVVFTEEMLSDFTAKRMDE